MQVQQFFRAACDDDFSVNKFLHENSDIHINITDDRQQTAIMVVAGQNEVSMRVLY